MIVDMPQFLDMQQIFTNKGTREAMYRKQLKLRTALLRDDT